MHYTYNSSNHRNSISVVHFETIKRSNYKLKTSLLLDKKETVMLLIPWPSAACFCAAFAGSWVLSVLSHMVYGKVYVDVENPPRPLLLKKIDFCRKFHANDLRAKNTMGKTARHLITHTSDWTARHQLNEWDQSDLTSLVSHNTTNNTSNSLIVIHVHGTVAHA